MSAPRIPPIACLQAFEAIARLHSVSGAADELNVTPSAVSHRLRQLESVVGARLFGRADFTLTADGAAYLVQVRIALQALYPLPWEPETRDAGVRLRVAVTPTFARELLMPRLAGFRRAWPDIELILQVAIPLLDVKGEDTDLELRFGTGPYAGMEHVRVLSDEISPVCSPEYAAEFGPFLHGFGTAAEVARVRLIRSPLEPWHTWFRAHALAMPEPREGAQFNDVGLMLDAAAVGFGVCLTRLRLGAAWLASGKLVRISPRAVPSPHHHFLCWRPGTLQRWECAAFVEWLTATMA
jgi:LysR family glycine cleavage system transcriptional activator